MGCVAQDIYIIIYSTNSKLIALKQTNSRKEEVPNCQETGSSGIKDCGSISSPFIV